MDKDKALQMCLEYIETDAEKDAHERKYVRLAIKQALAAQPAAVQEPVLDHSCKDNYDLIMKWADIYAAQTGNIYSEAARDPSKSARMADERTMLACVVSQALSHPALKPLTEQQKQELAENWFAEDWAITKAMGMMYDHERLLGITTGITEKGQP
jgi:hypothetical protein